MTAKVTSKFQMVLPKQIREHLGVRPGDRIDFVVEQDGKVSVHALNDDFRSLRGMFKSKLKKPVTLEEMDRAISRNARRAS